MELWEKIRNTYPELTNVDFDPSLGTIELRDDTDAQGAYIAKWNFEKPIPDGLTLGKPTA